MKNDKCSTPIINEVKNIKSKEGNEVIKVLNIIEKRLLEKEIPGSIILTPEGKMKFYFQGNMFWSEGIELYNGYTWQKFNQQLLKRIEENWKEVDIFYAKKKEN